MDRLLWICFGSAIGGGARHLVSSWALNAFGPAFPYGTLAVNVIGSLFLGLLMYAGVEASAISPAVSLALTTGVVGGAWWSGAQP